MTAIIIQHLNIYSNVSLSYLYMNTSLPALILDDHTAVHVAELFRSFSDTNRVRIISAIIDQEQNVSTLAQAVGMSESAVSHHLRGLRLLRLVQTRRQGKEIYYSLVDEHIITLFQQGVNHVLQG
jgi:ArsR family transcriptional regulator, lead/cadmium/zinc/bismuth-responsive transcriptional repressor